MYSKEEYLRMMEVAPIWGFPTEEEKMYKCNMVKVRGAKVCTGSHYRDKGNEVGLFYTGTLMLKETCLFDGAWRSAYTCTDCLDNWMEEIKKYVPNAY